MKTSKATLEEMKAEAVRRMKVLGVYSETVRQFEDDGLVSESVAPFGACYWLSDEQKKRVEDFEKRFGGLVYHVIHGNVILGGTDEMEMECMLYVPDEKDDWESDDFDLRNRCPVAYVYNVTCPMFSELGSIGVETTPAGGLRRTY